MADDDPTDCPWEIGRIGRENGEKPPKGLRDRLEDPYMVVNYEEIRNFRANAAAGLDLSGDERRLFGGQAHGAGLVEFLYRGNRPLDPANEGWQRSP